MIRKIFQSAYLTLRLAYGSTFFIFTIITIFFVLTSLLYFFLPELGRLNAYSPAQNAATGGIGAINFFLIFLTIFLSLSVLLRQFQRDNLIFMLSKPLSACQLLLGTSLGLAIVLLTFWLIVSLELLIIISIFSPGLLLNTFISLLPLALVAILYLSLTVFFFSLWRSFFSALFPFLFILISFTRMDIKLLIAHTHIDWLKNMIDTSFLFIPPISQLAAISLKAIAVADIRINIALVLLQSIFLVMFFHALSLRRISNILYR